VAAATAGLEGVIMTEMVALVAAGAVAFSDDGKTIQDSGVMRRVLEYSRLVDVPIIVHAEDRTLVADGVVNEGLVSTRLGLPGNPTLAEDVLVMRDLMLAELTGARLHVAHVSSAGSVESIRRAKERGVSVTAEVTPHHLALTDEAALGYDTNTKVSPPLRSAAARILSISRYGADWIRVSVGSSSPPTNGSAGPLIFGSSLTATALPA